MKVPFQNLYAQYLTIKDEIDIAISEVIKDSAFVRGRYVFNFEQKYADAFNVEHCISCANGTDAIYIALQALGIGPGDQVITTALSWIATSETISQTGAEVVFVDIDSTSFTIDPDKIEEKISEKTRAIIPVHLYGQPADMDSIMKIAKKHGLHVIEDCAQAHFSKYHGYYTGTMGDIGTFSFYPGKNLGAYGDAGALITKSQKIADRARMFANHGSLEKNKHEIEGINSRLDGLQGAILSVKMEHIAKWTMQRQEIATMYDEMLSDIREIIIPEVRVGSDHVYHLYVVRSTDRDQLIESLRVNEIVFGIHYPIALPFLPAYRYLGHKKTDFPVASRLQNEIISLPIYPEMTADMVEHVYRVVSNHYKA